MFTPRFQWLDKAGEALVQSFENGTMDHAVIEHVVYAAKAGATQEVKNLTGELGLYQKELAVAKEDLNWYRQKHPVLLNMLSETDKEAEARKNELVATKAILSSTLHVAGGADVAQLKRQLKDTMAALEMTAADNATLKRQHEEDQAELRKYRRDNARLNKRLRLAETGAKEPEGGSITP
jgi:chromosome segregation ATPase